LEDQQNKPVAVVLRKDATQDLTPALPEVIIRTKSLSNSWQGLSGLLHLWSRHSGIFAKNILLLLLLPMLLLSCLIQTLWHPCKQHPAAAAVANTAPAIALANTFYWSRASANKIGILKDLDSSGFHKFVSV